ncbi:SURF1 family protein [Oryzihumus leptocrescens]|uniref:SURF1-like protein n=1 Tax=Oryzihumus leptocrescens TaxID=297536 RepID=A0A542ZFQ9_9MICO|nr:SURF1 family protein [Oryzihumus leptocrescens]TQL59157.1 cytochrome oxidase assembly protein ShyY1 [Oryzihumus leptocrescens]
MLRTALRPRWLGLLALVVVVMVTFTMLGLWQLNVARDKGRAEAVRAAPQRPVAALTTVVQPQAQFPADGSGRRVTATGRYDAAGQVLVTPRLLDGRRGYWVVTPLVVEGTGARLAVVRGFVTDPAAATRPPATGPVMVTGSLAPAESPTEGAALPAGQLGSVDLADLVNRWGGQIYNAFVFATAERPDVTTGTTASAGIVRVPPPPPVGGGLALRNAGYAVQWWVFALFALYMWWRMVRDEHEREQSPARPAPAPQKVRKEVTDV